MNWVWLIGLIAAAGAAAVAVNRQARLRLKDAREIVKQIRTLPAALEIALEGVDKDEHCPVTGCFPSRDLWLLYRNSARMLRAGDRLFHKVKTPEAAQYYQELARNHKRLAGYLILCIPERLISRAVGREFQVCPMQVVVSYAWARASVDQLSELGDEHLADLLGTEA